MCMLEYLPFQQQQIRNVEFQNIAGTRFSVDHDVFKSERSTKDHSRSGGFLFVRLFLKQLSFYESKPLNDAAAGCKDGY